MSNNNEPVSIIPGDILQVAFTPVVFETHVLALYLQHRIDDYLNDPEPQADAFCESIPKDYLHELLGYLKGANEVYHAKSTEL